MSYDENEGLDGPRAQAPERRILLGHGSYGGPINGRILGLLVGGLGGFQGVEETAPFTRGNYDKLLESADERIRRIRDTLPRRHAPVTDADHGAMQMAEEKRRRKAKRKAASTRPKAESLVTTGGSTHE